MNKLLIDSKRFLKKNGSTILTCIGGVGVIVTAVMAVKATLKALRLIEEAEKEKGKKLTKTETVKVAWTPYIPTVLVGASTIACIFGANVLNKRRQAALMSAYALLDSSYKEYKQKVEDLYGEEADKKIREEIAKDNYEEDGIGNSNFEEEEDDGKLLFYDEYSQRYFRATSEAVLRASYELNKILVDDCYASLNELYNLLGIPNTDFGDRLGWSSTHMFEMYWSSWINFSYEKVTMDDGLECYIMHVTEPIIEYDCY